MTIQIISTLAIIPIFVLSFLCGVAGSIAVEENSMNKYRPIITVMLVADLFFAMVACLAIWE